MARKITVQAGPLAAASATKVGLVQKAAAAQYLVLNGAAGSFSATSISTAQSYSGAGAIVLDGTKVVSGVAVLSSMYRIYFTTSGNSSARTVTISGLGYGAGGGPFAVTETLTLANTGTVSSSNTYYSITGITISGASTGTVSVGHYGTATLDVARRLLFTDVGDNSGITYTVTGTDWAGSTISDVVTGTNGSTVASVLDFLTVTSILTSGAVATTVSVGTNGVCGSPWVRFDEYAAMGFVAIQVNGVTGATVNWTVQQTLDDPNLSQYAGAPDAVTRMGAKWVVHPDTALVASTTVSGVQGNYAYPPTFARIVLNSSGNGASDYVRAEFLQNYQK